MKKCLLLIFFSGFLFGLMGQEGNSPWKFSSPEDQGISSMTLINSIKHLRKENINIHSLLIIKNDHLVLDTYFYPFQKDFVHDLASITKSITSLLIGIAIDKGFIKNEDQYVIQYFPEYQIRNDTLKKLKIRDLLNMTSGFRCSWYNGEKELKQMNESKDWVKFMFNLPFESLPGTRFSYCSGNYYLLAEIIQRTTKLTCLDFARKYLFQPLAFGKSLWEENDKGVNQGWGDLYLSTHDLAKIGCLILNDGKWNGIQIISKEWLEKIKPLYRIQGTESYGYGWWLDDENPDEVQAVGRGGQRLFIFKNRNIVIATTGGGFEAGDLDNLVLESVKSYNKDNDNNPELDSLIRANQLPGPQDLNTSKSYLPVNLLNQDFQFDENSLKLKAIRFTQQDNVFIIKIVFADGSVEEHPIGMNNEYLISNERVQGLPIALKGQWDSDKLIIYYNELCGINLLRLSFTFFDNSVELNVEDLTDGWNMTLKGKS